MVLANDDLCERHRGRTKDISLIQAIGGENCDDVNTNGSAAMEGGEASEDDELVTRRLFLGRLQGGKC